jgi:hypothetical protein
VNETTSTPDEPDGRGRVATGEQPAVPPQASGPDAAAAAGTSGGSAPVNGSPAAPATEGDSTKTSDGDGPAPAGADAPTTVMRIPPPADGAASQQAPAQSAQDEQAGTQPVKPAAKQPQPAPAPPVEAPAARAEARAADAAQPTPAPRPPDPAPGPVPDPGPAAAPPPPWNRMPGQAPAGRQKRATPPPPPVSDEPAGGLFDDGPTAFLEPPRAAEEEAAAGSEGRSSTERASWATARAVRNRPPRQAALQLKRLDPWSVLKLGLVLSVVLFFIWLVAVGVLYGALDGMGVWDRLNGTYADLVSGETPSGSTLISAWRVFGFAAVIGAINSLLFAVAVTVGAFVYNVSADLVGGIEVTLSERD